MKATGILCAILATSALAQPHNNKKRHVHHHQQHHNKRALVTEWVTETLYVTEYIDATATSWFTPSQAEKPAATSAKASVPGQFFEGASSPVQNVPTVQQAAPTQAAPPVQQAPPPVVNQAPTTHELVVAPTPSPSSGNSGSGGNSGGAASRSGDLTYYAVGLGACGFDDSGKDRSTNIVALSHELMGPLSNSNPFCGRTITISANGKTTTCQVRDKCMGCAVNDIDVSEAAYIEIFGSLESGRRNVQWWFN
jgi:hypothetical protein